MSSRASFRALYITEGFVRYPASLRWKGLAYGRLCVLFSDVVYGQLCFCHICPVVQIWSKISSYTSHAFHRYTLQSEMRSSKCRISLKPQTANPIHPKPESLNLKPYTLNPQPQTRNPQPQTLHPKTLNPKP